MRIKAADGFSCNVTARAGLQHTEFPVVWGQVIHPDGTRTFLPPVGFRLEPSAPCSIEVVPASTEEDVPVTYLPRDA